MQILIVAATEQEIESFAGQKPDTDMLITGVGVPATLYHLHKRLQQVDYDLIIQAGIAGSFNSAVNLGSCFLVKQDCFADLGMEEHGKFTPLFDYGFMDKNAFPYSNGWLINTHPLLNKSPLPVVNAVTVNKVSDSALQKQQFVANYGAGLESMEGAALHYVCLQEHIPFLQLRSVSNYVGDRDKTNWRVQAAIENLNNALRKLLQQVT
jgi:futalosine hydrolase